MDDDLKERAEKFSMLELPGQPQGMHMGTSYLVHDLVARIEELEAQLKEYRRAAGTAGLCDGATKDRRIAELEGLLEKQNWRIDNLEGRIRWLNGEGD